MQRPTHSRLHVRDAHDAHTVFEAVRQGFLRPVTRRLNEVERSMYITSGAIFVWEESDDDLGLKRWTDGRVWSQSRMREPYLFYDERLPSDEARTNDHSSRSSGNIYRFVDGITRSGPISPALSHYDRSEHHPLGLVKQAYSAWVLENPEAKPRKWHLTAYFTYADLRQIPTIDQDPVLRGVTVPVGIYRSGKARSRNSDAGMGASPPSSPQPYTRGAAGLSVPNQASASQTANSSTALPSLQMAVASQPFDRRAPRRGQDSRNAEDQRIIDMFNSRSLT
ncbi:Gti1/Pac2 family-domain-containing protein [Russula brevipes]|nr:Gti1/Pac2 family-domain-containing protein [Russula brevipes]